MIVVVLDVIPETVAVISVPPVKDETVARPREPGVLLMVATFGLEEFQDTEVVKSCNVLSE